MNQAKVFNNSNTSNVSGQQGMTLIEVLASMIIFMVVTGAIYGVLQVAQQSRGAVNNEVQLTKTVRLGLNLIGRDTYNAGYGYPLSSTVVLRDNRISSLLGVPNDVDTSRDTVPPIIAGNNITLNTFNPAPSVRTDQVTFLFKDSTFNEVPPGSRVSHPLNINAATTSGTGIDEIVPISGSNAGCRINDLYLVTGNSGATIGVVTGLSGTNKIEFANGDPLGFNQTGTAGPLRSITVPASIIKVKMVTYFVTADGILTRREFVNVGPPSTAAFVDEPLVYGVEQFQISYILDTGAAVADPGDPDGVPASGDENLGLLMAVRQIRVTVTARTTELDSRGQPVRATESATFSTRNLGYDAS